VIMIRGIIISLSSVPSSVDPKESESPHDYYLQPSSVHPGSSFSTMKSSKVRLNSSSLIFSISSHCNEIHVCKDFLLVCVDLIVWAS
jgi:hypothetical protein